MAPVPLDFAIIFRHRGTPIPIPRTAVRRIVPKSLPGSIAYWMVRDGAEHKRIKCILDVETDFVGQLYYSELVTCTGAHLWLPNCYFGFRK